MNATLYEGALGRKLMGKEREPLNVRTMQARRRVASTGPTRAARAEQPTQASRTHDLGRSPHEDQVRAMRAGAWSKGSTVQGTPLFMAPEQIRGEPDERSNPRVPNVPRGGSQKAARWVSGVTGRSAVSCADTKTGRAYTTTKGCAPGHRQVGTRTTGAMQRVGAA